MITSIYPTPALAAIAVADHIGEMIAAKPDALLCLAAGHTSICVFDELIARCEAKQIDFSRVRVVGLDEWLGFGREDDGSCAGFLWRTLLPHINLAPQNIRLFDGKAADPAVECAAIEQYITNCGGIDYLLLGMGMNGHLALNEPGADFSAGAHVSGLDSTTKQVAHKYFSEGMPVLEQGITLGIANLLAAKCIQLTIFGEAKQQITQRLLASEPTAELPATALKTAPHAELVLDSAAAGVPATQS